MAPLPQFLRFRKIFLFCLLASTLFASSFSQHSVLGRRNLLEKSDQIDDNDDIDVSSLPKKKKSPSPSSTSTSTSKNQTKLIKPSSSSSSSSSKNQTKLTNKPTSSSSSHNSSQKNQTKLLKPKSTTSSKNKTKLTKPTSTTTTKNVGASLDPLKSTSSSKNKTKSSTNTITKSPPSQTTTKVNKQSPSKKEIQTQNKDQNQNKNKKSPSPPTTWMLNQDESEEDYDFISEIQNLPTKFHQTFVPDIHKISTTSKLYLTKANEEITQNFIKPYVSKQYASSVSTAISCAFIIVPFLLVSLLFNQITAYFSLQKLIIFIQIYLSIYFSILCLSCFVTGLEPLRFFYATSESTYVWLQVLQTLGYVMYLLILLMYLILVFSTESGLGQKFLGLAQTVVGFAIGLHYYVTVFHRVVLHQPPKTNWKVHGIYATCFLVICLLARAERRKKAYLEEGGEEGKLN